MPTRCLCTYLRRGFGTVAQQQGSAGNDFESSRRWVFCVATPSVVLDVHVLALGVAWVAVGFAIHTTDGFIHSIANTKLGLGRRRVIIDRGGGCRRVIIDRGGGCRRRAAEAIGDRRNRRDGWFEAIKYSGGGGGWDAWFATRVDIVAGFTTARCSKHLELCLEFTPWRGSHALGHGAHSLLGSLLSVAT